MSGPFYLKFTNASADKLFLDESFSQGAVVLGMGSATKLPLDVLDPNGGMTEMQMDQNAMSNIAGGHCYMGLGYSNYNSYVFGVKIVVPFQALHIGDRPYYEIAQSDAGTGPDWYKPVDDPASPCSFPALNGNLRYKISCTPTSTHTSLRVSVLIQNA